MKMLVTGAAGFIGAALCRRLLDDAGCSVVGLDNINDYYDPALKFARLATLGVGSDAASAHGCMCVSDTYGARFRFVRMDLRDAAGVDALFAQEHFDVVINLAAQAGVRYSIDNPRAYLASNVDGFLNVLESCRRTGVGHLVYASSSSVYGLNGKVPFSEHDAVDHPVSLYAATKKSNELMAHVYAHLYGLPVTGLRFFTVYGPWGRPDMSPFLFMDAILHGRPIRVFNGGRMRRDFTYIDDIVESVARVCRVVPKANPAWDAASADPATSAAPFRVYNIGNSQPVELMDYIACIEHAAGREAQKEFLPMQPGDVEQTYADSSALAEATGFRPCTPLRQGIERTVEWFKQYYNL